MAEDVVFLGPGRPPMRGREPFATASRAAGGRGRMEGHAEFQEVKVFGDRAYTWTRLRVTLDAPPWRRGLPARLEGPSLSVFVGSRRPDGSSSGTRT